MLFRTFQRKAEICLGFITCAAYFFWVSFASAEETANVSAPWRPVKGSSCILIQEKSVISEVSHQPMVYWRFQNVCEEPVTFSYHLVAQAASGWNVTVKSTKTIPLVVRLEAKQSQKGDDGIFGQFAPGTGIRFLRVFVESGPKSPSLKSKKADVPDSSPAASRTPSTDQKSRVAESSSAVAPQPEASLPTSESKNVLPFCMTGKTVLLGKCVCSPKDRMQAFPDDGSGVCLPKQVEQKGASKPAVIPAERFGEQFGPPPPPRVVPKQAETAVVICNPRMSTCP